jgi:nucleoid-associated protein YgaU
MMGFNSKKVVFKGVFVLGLLVLSACSSHEIQEADSAGDQASAPVAATEKAPTDAVPVESAVTDEPNIELELAAKAAQESGAASADSTAPEATAPKVGSGSEQPLPVSKDAPAANSAAVNAPVEPAPEANRAIASVEGAPVSPQAENSAPMDGVKYTVKAGDTLMKISWEQYGDLYRWREIYQLNTAKIADPNHVPPGTVITIAGGGRNPASVSEQQGQSYLIENGDSLSKISGKVYGSIEKWKKIWENNKQLIRDPNKIYAGFYLYYIPEAKMTSTEKSESNPDSSES